MNLPMRSQFRLAIGACLTLSLTSCGRFIPLPNFPSVPLQSTSAGQQCPDLSGVYLGETVAHLVKYRYDSDQIETINKAGYPHNSFWVFKENTRPFAAFGDGYRKKLYPINPQHDVSKEVDVKFVRWTRLSDFVYKVEAYSDGLSAPYVYSFDWSNNSICQSGQLIVSFKDRDSQEMIGNKYTLEERYYKTPDGRLIVDEIFYHHQRQFLVPTGIRTASRSRTEFIPIPEQEK